MLTASSRGSGARGFLEPRAGECRRFSTHPASPSPVARLSRPLPSRGTAKPWCAGYPREGGAHSLPRGVHRGVLHGAPARRRERASLVSAQGQSPCGARKRAMVQTPGRVAAREKKTRRVRAVPAGTPQSREKKVVLPPSQPLSVISCRNVVPPRHLWCE